MILSVDIGIRNLSLCIMSATDKTDIKTYTIHLWGVFDTLDSEEHSCNEKQKSGKICGKKCGYKYKLEDKTIHTCKTHFPKTIKINKSNIFKMKLIKDYLLQDIVTIFIKKVDEIYNTNKVLFDQLTHILIELQPTINPSMKCISHVLYGKFVEIFLDKKVVIKFIRASTKLRAYTGPPIVCKLKGLYAQRKWLSIQYAKFFLENKFNKDQKDKWLNLFTNSKKADDKSDCFLYCINFLHGMPKKLKTNKKGKCIK